MGKISNYSFYIMHFNNQEDLKFQLLESFAYSIGNSLFFRNLFYQGNVKNKNILLEYFRRDI